MLSLDASEMSKHTQHQRQVLINIIRAQIPSMRISAFPNWAHPHTAHTVLERNPVRRSFVLFATAQQRRAGVCPRRRSRCEEYFSAARRGSETPAPRLRTAWMRPALLIHCARANSLSHDVKKAARVLIAVSINIGTKANWAGLTCRSARSGAACRPTDSLL